MSWSCLNPFSTFFLRIAFQITENPSKTKDFPSPWDQHDWTTMSKSHHIHAPTPFFLYLEIAPL